MTITHYSSFAGRTYRNIKNCPPFKRNHSVPADQTSCFLAATDSNGHGWNVNGETMCFIGYRKQISQKIHESLRGGEVYRPLTPLDPRGWFIMCILGTNKVETKFNKIITMIYDQLPKDTSYTAGNIGIMLSHHKQHLLRIPGIFFSHHSKGTLMGV